MHLDSDEPSLQYETGCVQRCPASVTHAFSRKDPLKFISHDLRGSYETKQTQKRHSTVRWCRRHRHHHHHIIYKPKLNEHDDDDGHHYHSEV